MKKLLALSLVILSSYAFADHPYDVAPITNKCITQEQIKVYGALGSKPGIAPIPYGDTSMITLSELNSLGYCSENNFTECYVWMTGVDAQGNVIAEGEFQVNSVTGQITSLTQPPANSNCVIKPDNANNALVIENKNIG